MCVCVCVSVLLLCWRPTKGLPMQTSAGNAYACAHDTRAHDARAHDARAHDTRVLSNHVSIVELTAWFIYRVRAMPLCPSVRMCACMRLCHVSALRRARRRHRGGIFLSQPLLTPTKHPKPRRWNGLPSCVHATQFNYVITM